MTVCSSTHHLKSFLVPIWVEGGHQVDAYSLHQSLDFGVPVFVFFAQILHEQQDQLSPHRLISMEAGCEAKLRLT